MKIQDSVEQAYDQVAAAFQESRQDRKWPELNQMIEQVQPGSKVLDIGCGTGRLYNQLASKNVEYIGIDISQKQVDQAKRVYPKGKFIKGEMTKLDLPDESQDVVFFVASLHHLNTVKDRQAAINEAIRVLKPNGKLFITVMGLWKKKYRKLFFDKKAGLATLSKEQRKTIKWNDVFLPWRWKSEKEVHRYYHAFRKSEVRRLIPNSMRIDRLEYVKNGQKVKYSEANNLVLEATKK